MQNRQDRFEIAPPQEPVGTQILDRQMPSNLDFDSNKQEIELQDITSSKKQQDYGQQELMSVQIKSFMVKGNVSFQPQYEYKVGDIIQSQSKAYGVKAFDDENSGGLKGIWEALVGYCWRQLYINQGHIYLLIVQKTQRRVFARWRLADIFKIYLDHEESRIRLVIKAESDQLINRDYVTDSLKDIVKLLADQLQQIGLKLVG